MTEEVTGVKSSRVHPGSRDARPPLPLVRIQVRTIVGCRSVLVGSNRSHAVEGRFEIGPAQSIATDSMQPRHADREGRVQLRR